MYIIISVLFIIIAILIINFLYKETNYFKNQLIQVDKFREIPKDLEIINTGSSYAKYGFDFEHTSLKGFNFALQPQSLSYDYKILKQYTPNLKKNCIVLMTLPNFVYGFLDYKDDNANTKYYYFLNPININNYSRLKHILRTKLPILTAKRTIRYIIKDVLKDDSYNQNDNFMTIDQVEKDAHLRVLGWEKQFGVDRTKPDYLPEELKTMFIATTELVSNMINYCIQNNFRPILIIPPTSNIINTKVPKKLLDEFLYNNIHRSNNKGIPVLDYLYDERFQDYHLYINSDMLNKRGREKFTDTVMDDLKKLGLIGGKLI